LLNQTFWPDVASTAQHLQGLAAALAERGHEVTVVTSQRAYDHPERRFARRERWRGVEIYRIPCTGFGKGAKWRRAADFASFMVSCCLRLLVLPRQDAVVALTSPPLISFLGAWVSKVRGSRFYYWVMDLNPDEAIAAGWLRAESWVARVLDRMSRFSLRQAEKVIVLDRFMRERVAAKGIEASRIEVIPPWSQDDAVRYDAKGRERFRKAHGLEDKFVVMYSGNHSPCHPLDTLLEAARGMGGGSPKSKVQSPKSKGQGPKSKGQGPSSSIKSTTEDEESKVDGRSRVSGEGVQSCTGKEVVFCFVGGGSEWRKIREGIGEDSGKQKAEGRGQRAEIGGQGDLESRKLKAESRKQKSESRSQTDQLPTTNQPSTIDHQPSSNLLCLPYQPLEELAGSLSAADLQVVVMGERFVGTIHPCKIYNIFSLAAPVLYIGPSPSHASEILDDMGAHPLSGRAAHGDVEAVIRIIERVRALAGQRDFEAFGKVAAQFSKDVLLPKLVAVIEQEC